MIAPTIKLNNGQEIPILGLGTYRSTGNEGEEAIKYAIDIGYRHFDSAFVYQNEEEVGRALSAKISDGTVKRNDLYVVTKLAGIHHDPSIVEHACRKSLQNLKLDYIDLYLMHFPIGMKYVNDNDLSPMDPKTGEPLWSDVDYLDTWRGMEKLVDLNLVRSIGLSNFNSEQTERIVQNSRIKPVANQVECHPGFNQKKLIEYSRKHNIIIIAYCPLGRPNPTLKIPNFLFDHTTAEIAAKYKKTPAQIVLRYLIDIGTIPIPKSVTKARISQNFDVYDFKLTAEDISIMDRFNTDQRMIPFSAVKHHQFYPFTIPF